MNQPASPSLFQFALYMADNCLVLGHRLGEWCGHGPVLEQDIAMTNISLDLIGQARLYYQYAAELEGKGRTEDDLAYLRSEREYTNALLVELPNGDFAHTIARQFLFDAWHLPFLKTLLSSPDAGLADIAGKAVKEVTYHLKWSREWVLRLGDGTDESHRRMQAALDEAWMYRLELLMPAPFEQRLIDAGVLVGPEEIRDQWEQTIADTLREATLTTPDDPAVQTGGKTGVHTEHLGHMLADLQYMQRAYPGLEW